MPKKTLLLLLLFSLTLTQNIFSQSRLIINEVLTAPPSDVNGDGVFNPLSDQFIEFVNPSGQSLDISGWKITDETGLRYTFTSGTILPEGSALVLFGGGTTSGTFGGATIRVAPSPLSLNVAGGIIWLKNSSDAIIDVVEYGSEANQGQSIARNPDVTGSFVRHSTIAGASGALFSPGLSNANNSSHFPLSTTITASISGSISNDVNSDGIINPGDKVKYTVTVNNTGSQSAKGLTLTNTVDANTTLAASSLKTTPLALEDYYITSYNSQLNIGQTTGLIVNDSDPDGRGSVSVISYGTSSSPDITTVPGSSTSSDLGGNVAVSADGSFVYNPPIDQAGTDKFGYRIKDSDNNIQSAVAEIKIYTISPLAVADSYTGTSGSSLNVADCASDLTSNDRLGVPAAQIVSFGGGSAGGSVTTNAANSTADLGSGGSLKINANGSFDFVPNAGFKGVFTFSYSIQSAGVTSDAAVTVNVEQAPAASNDLVSSSSVPGDKYHTALNSALTVNAGSNDLLNNDNLGFPSAAITSFGGGSLEGNVTSNPAGSTANSLSGSLKLNSDGTFIFTPATDFTGIFSFSYRLTNSVGTSDGSVQLAVGVRPLASNDTYTGTVTGNVKINTSRSSNFGVLSNDAGDKITFSSMSLSSAQATAQGLSGNVILSSTTGTFTYNPPPGYEGSDSFTYTIQNGFGTSQATVNITVSGMVWFVNNSAGSTGDGRLSSPFNSLAAFSSINNGTGNNPASGDNIFLYTGSENYTGGLAILNSQKLLGQGSSSTLSQMTGITFSVDSDPVPSTGGTNPVIVNSSGTGITISQNNTIKGISVGTCSSSAISGTSFGTLNVSEVSINTSNQALSLSTGTLNGTFTSLTSTGGANNISLASVAGTLTISSGALSGSTSSAFVISGGSESVTYNGNISHSNNAALINISNHNSGTVIFQSGTLSATNGTGIQVSNADGTYNFNGTTQLNGGDAGIDITAGTDAANGSQGTFVFSGSTTITSPAGTAFNLSGSKASVTYSGNITQVNNSSLLSITNHSIGTITFQTGTLSATNGNGLQFSGASGTYNFNGTNTLNGGDAAIDILSSSNGTFTFSTSTSITNPSGIAFNLSSSNPALTFNGTISKNSSENLISLQSISGGSISFSGALSSTGTSSGISISNCTGGSTTISNSSKTFSTGTNNAVTLTSNTGHTVNFSNGGLNIVTTSGSGFTATGGGTISISGPNNNISSGAAIALNVQNTTIGSSGLNFVNISSSGSSSNGIILNNTGSSGGLTISGTGTANSGGTIQNSADAGIKLTNTSNPSFSYMNIQNTGHSGVKGTLITNFSFVNGAINNSGTAHGNDDSNISFNAFVNGTENNVSGTITITGNTLTNAYYHGVDIYNYNGTLTNVNVSNNTLTSSNNASSSLGSAIRLIAYGSASTAASVQKATISNNTITNFPSGGGIMAQAGNANNASAPVCTFGTPGDANNIIAITGNMIRGESSVNRMGTNAIITAVNGRGVGNFNISNNGTALNPLKDCAGTAIGVSAMGLTTVTATVNNNYINANNGLGSQGIGGGISNTFDNTTYTDNPNFTVTITNNHVQNTDGNGIWMTSNNCSGIMKAKIQNNIVSAPLSGVRPGIRVDCGTAARGNVTVNLNISGNTSAGSGGVQGIGLRKQGTLPNVFTFGINGMAATSTPDVEAYVNSLNPSGGGTLLISGTNGFTNCTLP